MEGQTQILISMLKTDLQYRYQNTKEKRENKSEDLAS